MSDMGMVRTAERLRGGQDDWVTERAHPFRNTRPHRSCNVTRKSADRRPHLPASLPVRPTQTSHETADTDSRPNAAAGTDRQSTGHARAGDNCHLTRHPTMQYVLTHATPYGCTCTTPLHDISRSRQSPRTPSRQHTFSAYSRKHGQHACPVTQYCNGCHSSGTQLPVVACGLRINRGQHGPVVIFERALRL